MTGSMGKMMYAFLWQGGGLVFGPNDQLMLRPRMNKLGAALMPSVNAFANLLTGFGESGCAVSNNPHPSSGTYTLILSAHHTHHTYHTYHTYHTPMCTHARSPPPTAHTDDNVQNAEDGELGCTVSCNPHLSPGTYIVAQRTQRTQRTEHTQHTHTYTHARACPATCSIPGRCAVPRSAGPLQVARGRR